MATRGRTDEELWTALGNLDDDLLNLDLPESIVDEELTTLGIDPDELAKRGVEFVALAKEQERLSWQVRAQRNREQLQALATGSQTRVPLGMSRQQILVRLDELRQADDEIGTAIKMAAHKRKAEESTDEELRALLEEMVHHLIRVLEASGESAAAVLAAKMGSKAEVVRELAYRLYTLCERQKHATEALAYNALVQSWPEITRLAREGSKPVTGQTAMFEEK